MVETLDTIGNDLVDFLYNIPALENPDNREILLHNLPRRLRLTMQRSAVFMPDIMQIVRQAREFKWLPRQGKYALEIVMDNARLFVEGTEKEKKLNRLASEYQRSVKIEDGIRVVTVAMTLKQAIEMDRESVFKSQEELEQYRELKITLHNNGAKDIISCYADNRDDWKPLVGEQVTVREIIQNLVNDLNTKGQRDAFCPLSLSDIFFHSEMEERCRAVDNLEEYGGILVIDPISLYHPEVRQVLDKSNLVGKPGIAMIVVSPLEPKSFIVNDLLEKQIYVPHLERAFHFYTRRLDPLYEFGIGHMCGLRRWLCITLPGLRQDKRNLSPEGHAAIRDELNQGKPPRGVGDLVTGSFR